MSRIILGLVLVLCARHVSYADTVTITVEGTVEFNQITSGLLGGVSFGDSAVMTFEVESDVFVDSASFPVRGYTIDPASFTFDIGGVSVGLAAAPPSYFSLRDNDPAVDGFILSDVVDFPFGAPLDVSGVFGPFKNNFYVTYGGSTLANLDILDAVGVYDFTGLSVYNWTIDDGAFQPLGIEFSSLSIDLAIAPFPIFRRGDANGDQGVDISDAVFLLSALFVAGSSSSGCADAADANDDGTLDISDPVSILSYLFVAGSPDLSPPGAVQCGDDPTSDVLDCAIPPCP